MLDKADFVIVGSGLTGCVLARTLCDNGYSVLVLERRSVIGGNLYDYKHESGILVNSNGPHYFRTNNIDIWRFLHRFSDFNDFKAEVKSRVNGTLINWPVQAEFIEQLVGKNWKSSFNGVPSNFEEAALAKMPEQIYNLLIKEYTEKQWGVSPKQLSSDLCIRFEVRHDNNPYLTPHYKYQGIPKDGYTALLNKMLAGITVLTGIDYLHNRSSFSANKMMIFTGPIDEYFNFRYGKLKYRSQNRTTEYFPHIQRYQPVVQINEPLHSHGAHIRTIEWRHMMLDPNTPITGTIITRETTKTADKSDEYEYPFPDTENQRLYRLYRSYADQLPNTMICGRLGEYKYIDMDQSIIRAFELTECILA